MGNAQTTGYNQNILKKLEKMMLLMNIKLKQLRN